MVPLGCNCTFHNFVEHSHNTRENTERTALNFEPLNWTLHHLTIGRLIAVQFNEDGSKQPDVEVEV